MDKRIIKVNDLSLWYGKTQALQNISLDIEENEITAIIGPSGCGKSTFLKTINRMVEIIPSVKIEGSIRLFDENIYDDSINLVNLRSIVGMVFQKPNPFPKSIYENVAYASKRHGIRDKAKLNEIVEKSLKQAALWDEVKGRLNESGFSLSGGQQQRLCVARALANEPQVILMDEPTSALDPIATGRLEELIQNLKNKYTVVIVTHNMQQAARLSDKTAFFLSGKMVEMDITNKIFTNPKNKKTEDYITGRFG